MKNERGFTLIELLVVIAILAVLFGVTALALSGVGSNAETEAKKGERDVVQTAIDVCSVKSSCTISGTVGLRYVGPDFGGGNTSEFGAYLRRTSKYQYTWDDDGKILAQQ